MSFENMHLSRGDAAVTFIRKIKSNSIRNSTTNLKVSQCTCHNAMHIGFNLYLVTIDADMP